MRLTIRSVLAATAIAAAALGSAATTAAVPTGPCADVPYVGVCEPLRGPQHRSPVNSQQGMADAVLPGLGSSSVG